jgi:arylsulfatase A-like enzyme
MFDDMGKEWVSAYGSESISTPAIDALASDGMRFDNVWSNPQCTPTRLSLLTGQYPFRNGWVNHWDTPRWGHGYFDWRKYPSLAGTLKQAGYATVAAGKWQVNDFRIEPEAMKKHGFDSYAMWTGWEEGVEASAERYWDPYIPHRVRKQDLRGSVRHRRFCRTPVRVHYRTQRWTVVRVFPPRFAASAVRNNAGPARYRGR